MRYNCKSFNIPCLLLSLTTLVCSFNHHTHRSKLQSSVRGISNSYQRTNKQTSYVLQQNPSTEIYYQSSSLPSSSSPEEQEKEEHNSSADKSLSSAEVSKSEEAGHMLLEDENSNNNESKWSKLKKKIGLKSRKEKDAESENLTIRQKLGKMGLSALLSYGFVSNLSYCVSVSLAWYGFSLKTKVSPLAPGQWKPFLAVYAGFYVFNSFVRPIRFAAAVAVTRYFDKAINMLQEKANCSRPVAIALVVFLTNICGTCSLMAFGIFLASIAAGVPIWVPK